MKGFRELVAGYGEGAVADAILKKWLSDDAGMEGFRRLAAQVEHGPFSQKRVKEPPLRNDAYTTR